MGYSSLRSGKEHFLCHRLLREVNAVNHLIFVKNYSWQDLGLFIIAEELFRNANLGQRAYCIYANRLLNPFAQVF
jgi:hypothetical protein